MLVTRRDLEGLLSELTQNVANPDAGLFGPDSVSWRVNREVALLAGGGRAALLQLAHPAVSHAIEQHSPTKTDPQGRFVRTFTAIFTMLFGDVASTVDAARRVHAIHAAIGGRITEAGGQFAAGDVYAANHVDALVWVFATLVDSALKTYSLLIEPLRREEREQFYREAKVFAQLFGIPEAELPPDLAALKRYMSDVIEGDTLHVTKFAREMGGFLLDSPAPIFKPMMTGYRVLTSGLLPESLRGAYGLPATPATQIAFWLEVRTLRAAIAALPARLRYFPMYNDAVRRLQGKGPDRVGHWIEQIVVKNMPQGAR